MAITPWMTSDQLIESVKRKISFPISQVTFTDEDILAFANEEMAISQIPSILSFHEEYFVATKTVPLEENKSRYSIPDRAIGMKLRDLFWLDSNENLFEMTRISPDDKAFFQRNVGSNVSQSIHKFYLEGDEVVLIPNITGTPTGSLVFVYFLRPNQLVKNDRAAIVQYFVKNVTIDNSAIVAGDTITIDGVIFTAVAGAPGVDEFQIGVTSVATATNIVSAVNTNGIVIGTNGSPSTNVVSLKYLDIKVEIETSNSSGFLISSGQGIEFEEMPSNITNGALVDFLQTKPGHKIKGMDVRISLNGISNTTIIDFSAGDVPEDLVIGDYICLVNECIIPQIPPDLHNGLAERTCARILAALGDQAGLASSNQKIQEIEVRQGSLIDNRVEGAPQKITARGSHLRYGKMGNRRGI